MSMEYFCCYHSYLKKCEKLSDQELGRLFRALMKFSETGETQDLTGRESIAFDFIADDIDRAKKHYEEKCKKNSENGKSGGRPKKQTDSDKQKKPNGFSESEKSQNKNEEENKRKNNIISSAQPDEIPFLGAQTAEVIRAKRTPTLDEVIAYAESRDRVDLAEKFFDYYEAADWHDSSGAKVRSWKQKFITWENKTPKPEESKKRMRKVSIPVERDEKGMVTKVRYEWVEVDE